MNTPTDTDKNTAVQDETLRLLPCPFCGRKGMVQWFWVGVNGHAQVECEDCLMSGPTKKTPEKAVAAWNTRANGWLPIETAPKMNSGLLLLWIVMADGSPVGPEDTPAYDIGWLEDGDWMIGPESEPSHETRPSHWQPLPKGPEE